MASLSFIMDVPDDRQSRDRPPSTQRDKEGTNKPHEAPSNEPHLSPGLAITAEEDINPAIPRGQTKRRSASSRRLKSAAPATSRAEPRAGTGAAAAPSPSSSSSSRSQSASTARPSTRRRSSTSNGSMDRPRYGPAAPASSSSAMGGGGTQRPMPLHPTAARFATRITPKTGRVSKAKKGLPVHVCDICSPPKTFTRAEHLRRHKLGHGEPQFRCSSCDKSFHRADLLARHQQKHEHEDDDVPKSATSTQQSPFPSPAALSFKPLHSPRTPGPGPAASPSASEIPPTPNTTTGRSRSTSGFSQLNNPAHGGSSSVYSTARGPSQDFRTSYTLSPTISIVNPTGSYASNLGDFQPRTTPPSICVVTEGLQLPRSRPTELPELHDASPWPSSASDSAYSTPVSEVSRYPRVWAQDTRSPTTVDWAAGSQRLSPYPPHVAPRSQSLGPAIEGIPTASSSLYMNSYSNTQTQEHHFGGMLGVPPSAGFSTSAAAGHHHPSLSGSSNSTVRPYQQHPSQHQHEDPASSARSGSPHHQLDASSHAGETIAVSAPMVPNRMDSLLGRKGVMVDPHQDLLGAQEAMCGLDVLGGLAASYGAGNSSMASPGLDHGSHSSALVAELDLAMAGGCAMPMIPSLAIPLPGPIRAAIPRYLEVYWAQVDPVLPLVHRPSFEVAPEDVLRCAMAAVATQNLNSREDRNRGNQLHEYAWQEVKRIPQWSLQTMQAILLCDYFARFRGRKAVTRPSKPFESLYSRVLYQDPALLGHAALAANQQHLSLQERWQSWVDTASRRRLFATCLFADGHAAIYQQQRRAQDADGDNSAALELVPLFGRNAMLWGASSAEQWAAMVAANPGAFEPEYVPPLEQLTSEDVAQRPPIDRLIILSVLALRLPRRQRPPPPTSLSENNSPLPELDPHTHHVGNQFNVNQHTSFLRHQSQQQHHHHQYHHAEYQVHDAYHFNAEERISTLFRACPIANTYLALHHTPLRDLLAVGGDSWVFSQKVLPATSFQEHQKRLRIWASSASTSSSASSTNSSSNDLAALSVTRATICAARALLAFLDRQPQPQAQGTTSTVNSSAPWSADMSDYWALYVCALICWAFSHRAPAPRIDTSTSAAPAATASAAAVIASQLQLQHPHPLHPHNISHRSGGSSAGSSPAPVSVSVSSAATTLSRPGSGVSSAAAPTSANSGNNNATWAEDEHEAVNWLRAVAAVATTAASEDSGTAASLARLRGRRGAVGVVGLVRRRLEADCLGSRSRLYVDAVGVLRKVEEGGGRKWF